MEEYLVTTGGKVASPPLLQEYGHKWCPTPLTKHTSGPPASHACMSLVLFALSALLLLQPGMIHGESCVSDVGNDALVPENPYLVTAVTDSDACAPFTKYMSVYGMLLIASTTGQDVPSAGLCWIAKVKQACVGVEPPL